MAKEKVKSAEADAVALDEPVQEIAPEPVMEQPKQVRSAPAEPEYTFSELVESSAAMGYSAECVVAALRHNGVKKATFAHAKAVVKQFMGKVIE